MSKVRWIKASFPIRSRIGGCSEALTQPSFSRALFLSTVHLSSG